MKNSMKKLSVLLAVAAACSAPVASAQGNSGEVMIAGELRRVMHDGDLSRSIALDTLQGRPQLYALGPLEGLRGEIVIRDGVPLVSRVEDGAVAASSTFHAGAAFLVYAQVREWQSVEIPAGLEGAAALERFIRQAAADAGVDVSRPFPFLISGVPELAKFHVVDKGTDLPHSPEEHDRINVGFELRDEMVEIVGFYSDAHHGIFTHHDSNVHMHLLTPDKRTAGHLDELRIKPHMILSIPEF